MAKHRPLRIPPVFSANKTITPAEQVRVVHFTPLQTIQPGTAGATTGLLALREKDTHAPSAKLYATGLAAAKRAAHDGQRKRTVPKDVAVVLFQAHLHNSRHLAKLHIAAWRATYRGIMPDELIVGLSMRQFEDRWDDLLSDPLDGVFTLLAVANDGKLAGFVRGGISRDDTTQGHFEIYALNIHPGYQRRGIGYLLLCEAVHRIGTTKAGSIIAWVLDANREARWFFKTLGAEILASGEDRVGATSLPKTAYAWRGTQDILPEGFSSRLEEKSWRNYSMP